MLMYLPLAAQYLLKEKRQIFQSTVIFKIMHVYKPGSVIDSHLSGIPVTGYL